MVFAEGKIEAGEGQEPTLIINDLKSLDDAVATRAKELNITIPNRASDERYFEDIYRLLDGHPGRCDVFLNLSADDALVKLRSESVSVAGSRGLQRQLENKGCVVDWGY